MTDPDLTPYPGIRRALETLPDAILTVHPREALSTQIVEIESRHVTGDSPDNVRVSSCSLRATGTNTPDALLHLDHLIRDLRA